MNREIHNPDTLFKHPAFSRVITISDPKKFHFMAGCTPTDINYECVHKGDMLGQYYAVMDNLKIVLDSIGATWDDIVFRRIYVVDIDSFLKINMDADIKEWFKPGKQPPSTVVEVSRLANPDYLIEIDFMAVT